MSNTASGAAPLVSIVTPAFNQGAFLAQTIDSVLAQDYPNIEYWVLDDGSTDETPAVISRYGRAIRSMRHLNMGQAKTLNKGWQMCRGEFLGYVSSDDILAPNAVSRLVQALISQPTAVVSYGDFTVIDSVGKVLRLIANGDYSERKLIEELVCLPGPGSLFRQSLLKQIGLWNPDLRQVPDLEFWIRASRVGEFVRIPQLVGQSRIHNGSASFSVISRERSEEILVVMNEFWARHQPDLSHARSMAWAGLLASKLHLQSGRFAEGVRCACNAWGRYPCVALELNCWRMLATGLLRRLYYRISGNV